MKIWFHGLTKIYFIIFLIYVCNQIMTLIILFWMPLLLSIALLVPTLLCAVDYRRNGMDWKMDSCDPKYNKAQSPIDIIPESALRQPHNKITISFNSNLNPTPFINTGYTIQFNTNHIRVHFQNLNGWPRTYISEQLHFHSRSEHSINGIYYDLELHIVCR